jgi:hypothetical protein
VDVKKVEFCSKKKEQKNMKRGRCSEEQIIGILREAQAGSPVKAGCAAHKISAATYHGRKRSRTKQDGQP